MSSEHRCLTPNMETSRKECGDKSPYGNQVKQFSFKDRFFPCNRAFCLFKLPCLDQKNGEFQSKEGITAEGWQWQQSGAVSWMQRNGRNPLRKDPSRILPGDLPFNLFFIPGLPCHIYLYVCLSFKGHHIIYRWLFSDGHC